MLESWYKGYNTPWFRSLGDEEKMSSVILLGSVLWLFSVHWHCWSADRKGIHSMKNLCHLPRDSFWNSWMKKTKVELANGKRLLEQRWRWIHRTLVSCYFTFRPFVIALRMCRVSVLSLTVGHSWSSTRRTLPSLLMCRRQNSSGEDFSRTRFDSSLLTFWV